MSIQVVIRATTMHIALTAIHILDNAKKPHTQAQCAAIAAAAVQQARNQAYMSGIPSVSQLPAWYSDNVGYYGKTFLKSAGRTLKSAFSSARQNIHSKRTSFSSYPYQTPY